MVMSHYPGDSSVSLWNNIENIIKTKLSNENLHCEKILPKPTAALTAQQNFWSKQNDVFVVGLAGGEGNDSIIYGELHFDYLFVCCLWTAKFICGEINVSGSLAM